jgi:molybdopterin-guanine dinucleotide biosynthesis protein A
MIELDGMLMVGSAASNVGKTELACALLRKFTKVREVIGIKVTAITGKEGQCPRGGEGCGVCSSLEGVYSIAEELDGSSEKDTARLLRAGASRVFWLRVEKEHLPEGIKALLDVTGRDTVSICESNSLREVVKPGLFLMVAKDEAATWKESAERVKKYADRVLVSDGSSYDLELDRMEFKQTRWVLRQQATAIVMAGGESKRMGTDKGLLSLRGRPIIESICEQLRDCFDEILISANQADKFGFLGLKVVPDKTPEQGPLMGIASALEVSSNELNFVIACDMPKVDLNLANRMLNEAKDKQADVVIPLTGRDRFEPLFGIYSKRALEAMHKALSSGRHKIVDIFPFCRVRHIELEYTDRLVNLNTPAEYEEYKKKLA